MRSINLLSDRLLKVRNIFAMAEVYKPSKPQYFRDVTLLLLRNLQVLRLDEINWFVDF